MSEPITSHEPETRRAFPPGAWKPMVQLARLAARPLDGFFRIEAASGIVLLLAAALALAWANSPWAASYSALWQLNLGVHLGPYAFQRSLAWVVNDVLMVIFFFTVGMEIRKELHDGELSSWRSASLPALAAVGGMVVPALLYLALASSGAAQAGWGTPMATDIAFAVGVLTLLGRRVPHPLRMLLLGLAVIDDLGAILVIAIFYSSQIALSGLLLAVLGVLGIVLLRAMGVRKVSAYIPPAAIVWAGTYVSGVHPTIAGVVIGLLTPVQAWLGPQGFAAEAQAQAEHVSHGISEARASAYELREPLKKIEFARREAVSPAEFLIGKLHPWVAFLIMPLFALANAGVDLRGTSFSGEALRVSLSIGLALVVGKPLGIFAVSFAALRVRLSTLPTGLGLRHIVVLGVVAGIGFTMSLFIAQLAFASPELLAAAKLGVLCASAVAMVLGLGIGRLLLRP
jgi:NhaA family Na+:H+ antiporter